MERASHAAGPCGLTSYSLVTLWPCQTLYQPAYCLKVNGSAKLLCTLPFAGHCLWGCPYHNIYNFLLPFFSDVSICYASAYLVWQSKSVASLILFGTPFCALWAHSLCAYINTHSLVASSILSNAVISLSISPIMLSSSNPWINCLVRLFIIFGCIDSLLPLFTMYPSIPGQIHDSSNSTIWFWYGLNYWLNIENSPFAFLQVSFSALIGVFIRADPPCLANSWLLGMFLYQGRHPGGPYLSRKKLLHALP